IIPPDATITEAYIEFTAESKDNKNPSNVNIFGELQLDPGAYVDTDDDISTRTVTSASIPWNFVSTWYEDLVYTSPDLTSIVTEIIGQAGWNSGNSMSFIFDATANQKRRGYTFDNDPLLAPKLHVTYLGGTPPAMITNNAHAYLVSEDHFLPEDLEVKNTMNDAIDVQLQEKERKFSDLLLFPNPTSGELNISFKANHDQDADLTIVSFDGKVVLRRSMQTNKGINKVVVSIDDFNKGTYVVMLKSGVQHISKTVILQ
ncbi:MAG: T9SS type A sorting domain-containing protein, partial [Saprospiraceae bacterium]|nr:T9SS type A sorting domain-containing protein [Saprospiraceae bacterium]